MTYTEATIGTDLEVSGDGRFLVNKKDGKPFLWLGDTAWSMAHRTSREEVDFYLETRKKQGFTISLAAALSWECQYVPNHYGHKPFEVDGDPTKPLIPEDKENGYWAHMDYIVNKAKELGLHIGLVVAWGGLVENTTDFDAENTAYTYGKFLGERYRYSDNVIWILGGDIVPKKVQVWRDIARGIGEGVCGGSVDYSKLLMTYHPLGCLSSSQHFHDENWLSFNMIQSGHDDDALNYSLIEADYARIPVKPVVDGEQGYEDIHFHLDVNYPRIDADFVRRRAYQTMFSGAFGLTYGANGVFQFWKEGYKDYWTGGVYPNNEQWDSRYPWHEIINFEGANNMIHLRKLLEARPQLLLVPNQSLIISEIGNTNASIRAASASDGSYAFVYIPMGVPEVTIDMSKISGTMSRCCWFNTREGNCSISGEYSNSGAQTFITPDDKDWVLVIDDMAAKYPEIKTLPI